VFRVGAHSRERQQPGRISTTVYSLYFTGHPRRPECKSAGHRP
jgi:hypothetical protein